MKALAVRGKKMEKRDERFNNYAIAQAVGAFNKQVCRGCIG